MALVGYVSDERFVALADVALDFASPQTGHVPTRSTAAGAVLIDLPDGTYQVTLQHPGYSGKRVELQLPVSHPYQFRLLSERLQGYMWPKWVHEGESAEFRVHSVAPYKLELFRYGYDRQKLRTIGWYDEHGPSATVQTTPDGDYSQSGAGWNTRGYTSPHHKQLITAPTPGGLLYMHARNERGEQFGFPWIVAPRQPRHRIAVLAANICWNAYNNFGGRSNYIHPEGLPDTPSVNTRLELRRYTDPEHLNYDRVDYPPLSFDRPESISHVPFAESITDPIEGRAACHVAPAEWRMLGWLEREGFDYDLYAETQFHADQLPLDDYSIVILGAHPEYWSQTMYDRLKRWVFDRGGRLMYLGGNGLNCDVEFVDDTTCIYRNEDNRRLRDEPRFESRFHLRHESEANLLGVVYDERGIMTAAPYRVLNADHWVFQGTGLSDQDLFGIHSQHERIPGGASGHETDKRSASSPPDTQLLARGENPDEGGAEMVLHETGSSGAVFSTGSINWISSLLVDAHVSRITANVIRRFLA